MPESVFQVIANSSDPGRRAGRNLTSEHFMNFCSDLSCQCYRRHITLSHTQPTLSRSDTIITLFTFCNSHVQGKNIIRDFF